jgi:hypothetical protein
VLQFSKIRLTLRLTAAIGVLFSIAVWSGSALAQDDPNETPLGDVARNLRKKPPASSPGSSDVIDNDNLTQVMDKAESKHTSGSVWKFLMSGESQGLHVSAADATCSLSFSANTKALLSSQYAQMDLPQNDMVKLAGPATIEGDALTVSVFNGTDWHVSEVDVALTVVKKNVNDGLTPVATGGEPASAATVLPSGSEVRPEKKPDTTVIYRMRAAASPWATTVFSAPLNLDLAAGDEWHWALVEAKGYPPQNYQGRTEQTTAVNAATVAPAQAPVIPASLLQPDSAASTLSQNPR